MPTVDDISWFKQNFSEEAARQTRGTPFTIDVLAAIASQETGMIWRVLRRKGLPTSEVLALCVGDTIDAKPGGKGRSVFPRTKAELIAAPNGQRMFDIARADVVAMAKHIPGYEFVATQPNKFAHGFGMFQLDLQHFKSEPDYFLNREYAVFSKALARCLRVLANQAQGIGLGGRASLSDLELVHVMIAYNIGSKNFRRERGLQQGHKAGGKFYGENVAAFLKLAKTVPGPSPAVNPIVNRADLPSPSPVTAAGIAMVVDTQMKPLNLRRSPSKTAPVDASLPDGHPVRALTGTVVNGFIEIETSLNGAFKKGFASADFLKPAPAKTEIPVVTPAAPTGPMLPAAHLTRRPDSITTRTAPAGAHSLNEPGQPVRRGANADELCAALARNLDWLGVDRPEHKRYAPRGTSTFCNIYAHDYATLADVYVPRVWWTGAAIARLAQGQTVAPLIGSTVMEINANGLFDWFRDFGASFGWRRTGTLTKLQAAANAGGVGVIVALRRERARSGHITMVVPEGLGVSAVRNSANEVERPVESQAGVSNFRMGHNRQEWWRDAKFEDAAFWIHA